MACIYIENLSPVYREKLKNKELSLETIDSLFQSLAKKYRLHQKGMKLASVVMAGILALMMILTLTSPNVPGDKKVIGLSMAFIAVAGILILFLIYYIAVMRVPLQFCRYLKKGYPELADKYNYSAFKNFTA